MNKEDIILKTVKVPSVMADIDWTKMRDDQTTQDMIKYLQFERQKALMANWEPVLQTNLDDKELLSRFDEQMIDDNPMVELLHRLLQKTDQGSFSWCWDDFVGKEGKRNLSRIEVNITEKDSHKDNPFDRRDFTSGNLSVAIRGHMHGDALAKPHFWDLSSRTHQFLSILKPLIRYMGRAEPDLYINTTFRRNNNLSAFTRSPKPDIDILGISLYIGNLLIFCDFRKRNNFDAWCNHYGHTVFHIRNRALDIRNAREALLISNNEETLFSFHWDDNLRNMLFGETPSDEELMMIEMAGFRDEFWLDNIDGFDRLKIKPFNKTEQEKWRIRTLPRFKF